jgi:hypothetical protein
VFLPMFTPWIIADPVPILTHSTNYTFQINNYMLAVSMFTFKMFNSHNFSVNETIFYKNFPIDYLSLIFIDISALPHDKFIIHGLLTNNFKFFIF